MPLLEHIQRIIRPTNITLDFLFNQLSVISLVKCVNQISRRRVQMSLFSPYVQMPVHSECECVIMQKSRRSHHFMQAKVAFANAAL